MKNKWNANADEFNQWCELSEDEKINFTIACAAHKAATLIDDNRLANEVAEGILYT